MTALSPYHRILSSSGINNSSDFNKPTSSIVDVAVLQSERDYMLDHVSIKQVAALSLYHCNLSPRGSTTGVNIE